MTLDILGKATFRIRISPTIKRCDLLQRHSAHITASPFSFITSSLLFCGLDAQSALSTSVKCHVAESTRVPWRRGASPTVSQVEASGGGGGGVVGEPVAQGGVAQAREGFGLDLAHALTGEPELLADLL